MDEIIERIPQLENKTYIIGGPREQALKEALTLVLEITDKYFFSTEFYCLKDTEEDLKAKYEEIATATGLGKGGLTYFRKQKNGEIEVINNKIWASHRRRFVHLVFIDSLEALHLKGQMHNREEVLRRLTKVNPVIVVSEELAPTGSDGGQFECDGETVSLTLR